MQRLASEHKLLGTSPKYDSPTADWITLVVGGANGRCLLVSSSLNLSRRFPVLSTCAYDGLPQVGAVCLIQRRAQQLLVINSMYSSFHLEQFVVAAVFCILFFPRSEDAL